MHSLAYDAIVPDRGFFANPDPITALTKPYSAWETLGAKQHYLKKHRDDTSEHLV